MKKTTVGLMQNLLIRLQKTTITVFSPICSLGTNGFAPFYVSTYFCFVVANALKKSCKKFENNMSSFFTILSMLEIKMIL